VALYGIKGRGGKNAVTKWHAIYAKWLKFKIGHYNIISFVSFISKLYDYLFCLIINIIHYSYLDIILLNIILININRIYL
jgi:hypothetical protein